MPDGAKIHLLGKGALTRTVRVSAEALALFEALGRTAAEDYIFFSKPQTRRTFNSSSDRSSHGKVGQACGCAGSSAQIAPYPSNYSIRRGCNVFTFQNTSGHKTLDTTSCYVAASPSDSSSLSLG